MTETDVINKVRKLLRLSSSTNEHEAALAASKARELLCKYNVELVDTESINQINVTEESSHVVINSDWIKILAIHLAGVFNCEVLLRSIASHVLPTFVGISIDAKVAKETFEYLYSELLKLSVTHLNTDESSSYMLGSVQKLRELLVVSTLDSKRSELSHCKSLMTLKPTYIKNYINDKYPDIKSSESYISDVDRELYYRGYFDAKSINITNEL